MMNASQTAYLGELYGKTDAERRDVVVTHLKVLAHAFEHCGFGNTMSEVQTIDYTLAAGACRYAAERIGDRPVAPLTGLTPTKSGFYWAQWRKAIAGTRDAAELTPSDEWQPVQVFENALDDPDPEYLMVEVGGVEKAQSLDCFVWGPAIGLQSDLADFERGVLQALADPLAVHVNMLRGTIAKPSFTNMLHLYPEDAAELVAPIAISQAKASEGIAAIAAERQRQIDAEGWTPEHDDTHASGEMALAAACYALNTTDDGDGPEIRLVGAEFWPWADEWWKPTDRRRDLVKAGALIAAEIDRLDRRAETPHPCNFCTPATQTTEGKANG